MVRNYPKSGTPPVPTIPDLGGATCNIITEKQYGFRQRRSCVTNLLSFYSRVTNIVQERDVWVDCIYTVPGFAEGFRQSSTYKIIMEAGKQRRIERGNVKLDGKLFKGKRNENSGEGQEIGMEKSRQRGASGISTSTSTLSNICM